MEKGAFGFAYETVRRLNMEVQKKKDRKHSLLESLLYGAVDGGEAYNRYHRSISLQFQEEAELFDTARKNVQRVRLRSMLRELTVVRQRRRIREFFNWLKSLRRKLVLRRRYIRIC